MVQYSTVTVGEIRGRPARERKMWPPWRRCCWCKPRVDEGVAAPDCVVNGVHAETEWADGTPVDVPGGGRPQQVHRVHIVADCEARYLDGATADDCGRDYRSVRFVCVSDTRGLHAQLQLPDDPNMVLLHCGDYSSPFSNAAASRRAFDDWLAELPYRVKVVVPGDHDSSKATALSHATHYLRGDAAVDVLGVRVFGAPHHPSSCFWGNGAFGAHRGARRAMYESADLAGVHVFATHCPPFGVGDRDLETGGGHTGCAEQLKALRRVRPRAHVHGRSRVNRGVSRFWHSLKKGDDDSDEDDEDDTRKLHGNNNNGAEMVSNLLGVSKSFRRIPPSEVSCVAASELDVELELGAMVGSSSSSPSPGQLRGASYRMRRRTSNTAEGTLMINAASTGNVDAMQHGGVAPPIVLEVVMHRRKNAYST